MFQAILSNFGFWTPPSLDLVLCRFGLIHFETPFISSFHCSSLHLHILPDLVLCRFSLIYFRTPSSHFSLLRLALHLHIPPGSLQIWLYTLSYPLHFRFSADLALYIVIPSSFQVFCRFGFIHCQTLLISLFISSSPHSFISLFL